jgi:hypothetical protein
MALLAVGCGNSGHSRSDERPPSTINVSIQIGDESITASPRKFGAGPITLLINNQSGVSHALVMEGPRLKRAIGPIASQDTAALKVTVQPGAYEIAAAGAPTLTPVRLAVGAERPSAQNELQLP